MGSICTNINHNVYIQPVTNVQDIRMIFRNMTLLGDGGSCSVYKALDTDTGRYVALKRMPKRDLNSKKMFHHEINLLATLSHKNVINFEGAYATVRHLFITTELASGGDLLDRIRNHFQKGGRFGEIYVRERLIQMFSAVNYLHSKNIVHRDIKPENFVFANEGVNSPLLLIDFGIALKINDKRRYDDLLGTPFYMAPECVTKAMRRGEDLKKGDIWAIGVVAYILCTGKPPFVGNTTKEIFYQLATQEVTFSKQTKLSSEGRTFLLRLLDRDYFARPTGEVCMADPWMQCNQDNDLGADVVGKLVNFKLARKLKRIVSKIVKKQQGEQGETDLKNFFVNLDHNKDGKIDIEEVSNFLRAHDFPEFKVNEKATEIMKAIDNDKDGKVTIKEFEEGWSKYKISKDKKLCYAIYKVFDRNGDGSIDMSELKKVIMGPNKKESAELRNLFKFFDTNNDGEISFQEFENALKNLQIMDDDSLATANRVSCLFSLGLKPDHDEKHISLAHDAEYVRKSIQNGEPLNLDIKG